GDPNASRIIVGPTKFEPVTIERGITRDDAFEKWAQAMQQGAGPPPRKDVRIELHDGERRLTVAWVLKRALVIKFEATRPQCREQCRCHRPAAVRIGGARARPRPAMLSG